MNRKPYQDNEGELICKCNKRHPPIMIWLNKNDSSLRCYCEECVPNDLIIKSGGSAACEPGYEKYYRFE